MITIAAGTPIFGLSMFSKLLKRKPHVHAPSNPQVPEGVAVWAIGDVHGRLDLLKPLVEAITADAASTAADRKLVIFLGDYVDRGSQSRGVIQFLAELGDEPDIEWRFLRGNHEETMLHFLKEPSVGPQWCDYGGGDTLESYGLRKPSLTHRLDAWAHLSAELDHMLSSKERRFLETLEMSVSVGDYFFAHAGALPGVALEEQSEDDLLWIRRTFLDSDVAFERIIVHGHTPTKHIHSDRRRIGIDTKAYASGVLTALRLEGVRKSFSQARIDERGMVFVTADACVMPIANAA